MIELTGDLIQLAKEGKFDIVAHCANCFCTMKRGIAPQMALAFHCDKFKMEGEGYFGDINKLGNIDYDFNKEHNITVVNMYGQYHFWDKNRKYGIQLDYDALRLCLRKVNMLFKSQRIGLPKIGCGLAGGDWNIVKGIIEEELYECDVYIVNYTKQ